MQKAWFEHHLRARYQETDAMGVVYHANYLNWFEISRTEWVRSIGVPYTEFESKGFMLPVIEADMKFLSPARYDDEITIRNRLIDFSQTRLSFEYEIVKSIEGTVLVTGSTKHVWINQEWRPISIKRVTPELFARIQAQVQSMEK